MKSVTMNVYVSKIQGQMESDDFFVIFYALFCVLVCFALLCFSLILEKI